MPCPAPTSATVTVEPFGSNVFIEEITSEKTRGGIIIPPGAKGNPVRIGRVVKCGPGEMSDCGIFQPVRLRPGVKVMFKEHGAEPLPIPGDNGREWLLAREADVLAVVEG